MLAQRFNEVEMKTVGKSMGRGAAWMITGRFIDKILGLGSTIVLARLLLPEHFGIVMIATSVMAALELMGAFSFETVLIQLQDATREHYDTVWTIGIIFNGIYAILLSIGAWPLAIFYNDERLAVAFFVIAITRFIGGFGNIGVIDFRKNLEFANDFYFGIAKKITTVLATALAAYFLRDHRALLLGIFIGTIYGLIISYTRHSFRPRFSLKCRQDIFKSASWLFLHNIMYFLNTRSADFIIAKLTGTTGLAIFNIANEVGAIPVTEIAAPVNRAAMPAYAKVQNNPVELLRIYKSTLAAMALVLLPSAVMIACIAKIFVPTILGDSWNQVIDLIPILAMAALPTALVNNNGVVLLSMGDSRLNALLSGLRAAILLILLLILAMIYGPIGAAYAMLITSLVFYPISHFALTMKIDLKFRDCLQTCLRPIAASLPMGIAVFILSKQLTPSLLNLLAALACGALIYLTVIIALWLLSGRPESHEKTVILFFMNKFK